MSQWVARELQGLDLGDRRLNRRLVKMVEAFSAHPEASVPQASGDWAATKGAYRFWDSEQVDAAAILAPHLQASRGRASCQARVLVVQDTTDLDFSTHASTEGIGPLDNPWVQGLKVHSAMLVSLEGVPLGLVHQVVWARAAGRVTLHRRRRETAEKESQRWLTALQASQASLPPELAVITVADREADIFDLFASPRRPGSHLLIRAAHNRRVSQAEQYVQAAIRAAPLAGRLTIQVPRHDEVPARSAVLSVRFASLTWMPPRHHKQRAKLQPVPVQVVLASEEQPPDGRQAVSWLLVTTLPVTDLAQAQQIVAWYARRWLIERFHFVLKSGCGLEALQLETADRLQRALATYDLVAWRLLWLTYQARAQPDQLATPSLSADEIQVLYRVHFPTAPQPDPSPTLQQAVRWIAQLGGFLARTGDGEPGVKTLWRGLRRLSDLLDGWRAATSISSPPNLTPSYG
jgi:hypothetical protein